MKSFCLFLFIIFICIFFIPVPIYAQKNTSVIVYVSVNSSENSASYPVVKIQKKTEIPDNRKQKLAEVLSHYNSPLLPFIDEIISASDLYGIDWKLVPAIAGVESGFCNQIPRHSYNCWGFDNGNHTFIDYINAIYDISRVLRLQYIDNGLIKPEQMVSVYAPSSSTWASKVYYFMQMLDTSRQEILILQINI